MFVGDLSLERLRGGVQTGLLPRGVSPQARRGPYGTMGRDHTATLRIGDTAPGFTLESSDGVAVTIGDWTAPRVAATGAPPKAVLLVFVRGTF